MYGQSPMMVDPTERMMGEPEQYFWGALVKAIPAVLGALGGGGGGAAGGMGGGLIGNLLGGLLGGSKQQQQPTAGGQPITINAAMGGSIPNKYKGFSKLPESVQQKISPTLAKQYMNGGMAKGASSDMQRLYEMRKQQQMMYGGAAKRKYVLGSVVKNLLGGM